MEIIIPLLVIVVVAGSDWRYRAKRDGAKEATKAYLFAGAVFAFGNICYQKFGVQGLLLVPVLILIVMLIVLLRRPKQSTEVLGNSGF